MEWSFVMGRDLCEEERNLERDCVVEEDGPSIIERSPLAVDSFG